MSHPKTMPSKNHAIHKLDFKKQVVLALVAPLLLITIIIGSYTAWKSINQAERELKIMGDISARTLGDRFAFMVSVGDKDLNKEMKKTIRSEKLLRTIRIEYPLGEVTTESECKSKTDSQIPGRLFTKKFIVPALNTARDSMEEELYESEQTKTVPIVNNVGKITIVLSEEEMIRQKSRAVWFASIIIVSALLLGLLLAHYFAKKIIQRNDELDQARQDALVASKTKSEFLARISHEIRTPLNAVLGYSALMRKSQNKTEIKHLTNVIKMATGQITTIIDDVLNISRLEAEAVTLEYRQFNLRDFLENIISMFSEAAYEKHLALILYIHHDIPAIVESDPARLSQIISNLLSNAIKFTDAGEVVLLVKYDETNKDDTIEPHIQYEVQDTGIGIEDKQKNRIFETFQQADNTITRRFGGTGLGLSIIRHLINLMNGSIKLETQIGQGSQFILNFPLKNHQLVDTSSIYNLNKKVANLAGHRMLVCEKNNMTRGAIRHLLMHWGIEVFDYKTLQEAEKKCQAINFEPALFDLALIGLPVNISSSKNLDLAYIKTFIVENQLPSIILSADIHWKLPLNLQQTELFCSIQKPVRRESLLYAIFKSWQLDTSFLNETEETIQYNFPDNLNILLAEDNRFNAELIEKYIEEVQADLTIVENGLQAIEACQLKKYDVILLDWHMPKVDGMTAAKTIKERTKNINTPLILVTADVYENHNNQLFSACVYKPISQKRLLKTLQNIILNTEEDDITTNSILTKTPVVEQLAPEWVAEIKRLGKAIQQALLQKDMLELRTLLHQLKGVTGSKSTADIRQLTQSCYQPIKDKQPEDIQLQAAKIKQLHTLIQMIKAY